MPAERFADVIAELKRNSPRVMFLTGKTCTGKTTLADIIRREIGYGVVELDTIVCQLETPTDSNKFAEVYRNRGQTGLVDEFVNNTRENLESCLQSHPGVLFEGALANNDTLSEIIDGWQDSFSFVYLLPVNLEKYKRQITERFKLTTPDDNNGLSSSFWRGLDAAQLERF